MATEGKEKRAREGGSDTPTKQKKRAQSEPAAPASDDAAARSTDDGESDGVVVARGESASLAEGGGEEAGRKLVAEGETDDEPDLPAAQLGVDRYVMAAFFAGAIICAYVAGKLIYTVWTSLSNKDFFSQNLPALAAVSDDDKTTIGMVIGGIVCFAFAIRTYRRPDVRRWCDDVASELTKVKWPTKKDVTNSTIVVIAASTVATVYLALLDRLWAFVTSHLVYGTGS